MSEQTALQPINIQEILPVKSQIPTMADMIVAAVEGGQIDAPTLLVKLKFLDEVFSEVRTKLEESVRDTVVKENGKMEVLGAKVEAAEVGIKYSYDKDVIWNRLQDELTPLLTKIKEREGILKTIKYKKIEVDESSGETIEVFPAIKTSKSSIRISLGR